VQQFNINDWCVLPSRNLITRAQAQIQLEPKIMAVLCFLATHEGEVCRRELIMNTIWPDVVVGDEVLTRAISKLRQLFGDTKRPHQIIETIPKKGYRLAISITLLPLQTTIDETCSETEIAKQTKLTPKLEQPQQLALKRFTIKGFYFTVVLLALIIFATFKWLVNAPVINAIEIKPHFTNWQTLSTANKGLSAVNISPNGKEAVLAQQVTAINEDKITGNSQTIKKSRLFISNSQDIMQPVREIAISANAEFSSPVWSNKGDRIAYVSRLKNACEIVVYQIESQTKQIIADCVNARHLSWHPNDEQLVYSDMVSNSKSSKLYLLSLSTSTSEQLTKPNKEGWGDFNPLISADGQNLIFYRSSIGEFSGIYQLNLQNRQVKQLLHISEYVNGLTLKGKNQLLYSSYHGNYYQVWLYNFVTDDTPRLVSEGIGTIKIWPSTIQDSFIFSKVNYDLNLFKIPLSNTEALLPADNLNSDLAESRAQFSPDNKWLAFISNRTGQSQLWLKSNSNNNSPIQVTFGKGYFVGLPVWSPASQYIYTTFKAFGKPTALYRYHLKSNGLEQISTDNADYEAPMALNENELLVSSNRDGHWKIWHFDIANKRSDIYSDVSVNSIKKAPQNNGILYVKRYWPGLWHREENKPEKLLITGIDQIQDSQNWFSTETGIYVSRRTGNFDTILQFYDWQNKEIKQVASLGRLKTNSGIALNTSTKTILMSKVSSSTNQLISAKLVDSRQQ